VVLPGIRFGEQHDHPHILDGLGFETTQHFCHLARLQGSGRGRIVCHGLEWAERIANQVEGALHLPVPQPPADVRLDDIGKTAAFRTVLRICL
jgi:hypothetical protein